MTEGEENIIIKGVLLEAISRDFSEELSNNKEVSVSQIIINLSTERARLLRRASLRYLIKAQIS